jgi:nucleoredoxin
LTYGHICRPCRGFTPVLADFYKKLVKDDPDALEIIFASSDNDEESFDEYYGEQPWSAFAFESAEINTLAQKYGVRGIPTFVVLKASDLSTVDANARSTVASANGDVNKALSKWGLL